MWMVEKQFIASLLYGPTKFSLAQYQFDFMSTAAQARSIATVATSSTVDLILMRWRGETYLLEGSHWKLFFRVNANNKVNENDDAWEKEGLRTTV